MRIIHCALAVAALAACGDEAGRKPSAHAHPPMNDKAAPVAAGRIDAVTEFGGGRVPLQVEACKAALAAMTGARPESIGGGFVAGTLAEVSRPGSAGGPGRIRCRADTPSGLSWADTSGDADATRWTDANRVTFGRAGEVLKVVVSQDGTAREASYPLAALRSGGS